MTGIFLPSLEALVGTHMDSLGERESWGAHIGFEVPEEHLGRGIKEAAGSQEGWH